MSLPYFLIANDLTDYVISTDVPFAWYLWHFSRRVHEQSPDALSGFHANTIDHLNTLAVIGDLVVCQNSEEQRL